MFLEPVSEYAEYATFARLKSMRFMPVSTNAIDRVGLFFESYTRALENFDTKHMTQHFMLPAMMLSDDNCTVFPEASKLEGLFNQGISFYRQYGIVHARPEIWSKKMLSSRIVKVKVNWQYFDADNHPAYNCDDHYILKLDKQNEWKIQVMVSVNEKDRMAAWLESKKAATGAA